MHLVRTSISPTTGYSELGRNFHDPWSSDLVLLPTRITRRPFSNSSKQPLWPRIKLSLNDSPTGSSVYLPRH
ncbi:hypothetical protein HanXRQr2_Chr03g0137231 [Helianthus annuus]|uniref:Uncharacterized protein n=1 Tax=Helianthus annuus TaxID=4232 RepID=A0A9K3JKU2_HELAN|nr:hypothetical protein HanXRQr2_Chr03g0137231 [Helianthus annuus]KAJ0945955.1 hypothetical protein HanPSC8_Chr03g0133841 [Helianthus annuus]